MQKTLMIPPKKLLELTDLLKPVRVNKFIKVAG
jgi:hypothetical protein